MTTVTDTISDCLDVWTVEQFGAAVRAKLQLQSGDVADVELQRIMSNGFFLNAVTVVPASPDAGPEDMPVALIRNLTHDLAGLLDRLTAAALGADPQAQIVTVKIPGTRPDQFGSFIKVDLAEARAWLLGPHDNGGTRAERYEFTGGWGTVITDPTVADNLTDAVRDLGRAGIITSPVGAVPFLDALAGNELAVADVRLLVGIAGHRRGEHHAAHTIADLYTDLRQFLNAPVYDGDDNPAVTRAVDAIATLIYEANLLLARFYTDFRPV